MRALKEGNLNGVVQNTTNIGNSSMDVLVIPSKGCICPHCGTSYFVNKVVCCSFCHRTLIKED